MYEELYRQNVRLIRKMANRYRSACERDNAVDIDDLLQAGFIGLVCADKTYDATAGKSWAGWAAWYISNAMKSALGMQGAVKAHTWATSLDAPIGDEITLADTLADDNLPDDDLLRQEVVQTVREAVGGLKNDLQRQVIWLKYIDGKTATEVMEALHINIHRVRNAREYGMRNLRMNRKLRALADLDSRTRFIAYKGVEAFNRDWTSTVEAAVLWREEQRNPSFSSANHP